MSFLKNMYHVRSSQIVQKHRSFLSSQRSDFDIENPAGQNVSFLKGNIAKIVSSKVFQYIYIQQKPELQKPKKFSPKATQRTYPFKVP